MLNSAGIIFAADIDKKENLLGTIRSVSPYIEAIKIGNIVLLEHGLEIIKIIKDNTDKPLLIDIKFMDIQYIAERIVTKILSHGGDGIMVSGVVGGDVISACKKIMSKKMLFVFTQFTHMSGLISDEMADEYIDLAITLECNGVQVPATFPKRISNVRKSVGKELIIISCGIGAQGAKIGSAIAAGANYEIIGRSIYNPIAPSQSPAEAAESAKNKIRKVLLSRENCALPASTSPESPLNSKSGINHSYWIERTVNCY